MKTIYRYEVPIASGPEALVVTGPPIHGVSKVTVNESRNLEFWGQVDTDADEITSYFRVIGTGWEIPDGWTYLGTAERVGSFVWHLIAHFSREPIKTGDD